MEMLSERKWPKRLRIGGLLFLFSALYFNVEALVCPFPLGGWKGRLETGREEGNAFSALGSVIRSISTSVETVNLSMFMEPFQVCPFPRGIEFSEVCDKILKSPPVLERAEFDETCDVKLLKSSSVACILFSRTAFRGTGATFSVISARLPRKFALEQSVQLVEKFSTLKQLSTEYSRPPRGARGALSRLKQLSNEFIRSPRGTRQF